MLLSEFGWYRGNRNTKFVPVRIDRDFLYLGVRRLKYLQILEDFDGKALPKLETDRLILRQRTVGDVPAMFDYVCLEEVAYPAGLSPIASLEDEYDYFENRYYQNLEKAKLPSGYGITVKEVIGLSDLAPLTIAMKTMFSRFAICFILTTGVMAT